MKNLFSLVILAMVLSPASGAQTGAEFLGPLPSAKRTELFQKGELTNFGGSLGEMQFLTWRPSVDSLKTALGNPECNIGVEALFWIPLSRVSQEIPSGAVRTPDWLDRKILAAMGKFEAMKGLQYYSVSRKRMEVLIQESYLLPEKKTAGGEITVFQQDNTFGGNTYTVKTANPSPGTVRMTMANQSTMSWGVLPLVSPGNFRLGLQIHVLEDGVLVYGLSTVKTLGLFGLERSKEDSFYNRLKAFSSWLEKQLVEKTP